MNPSPGTPSTEELNKILEALCGIKMEDLNTPPNTMFELYQRELVRKPTQQEKDEFKRNREHMQQWEFYNWYWNLGDKRYEVGDVVTRDGTDEHVIEDIDYDYGLITVRCTKEPATFDGNEPWTRVGEVEPNLIRRYSRI